MKRFSETTKWDDPWFRGLKPPEKLLFLFFVDNCNNAGFYEIDMGAMAFKTGMTEAQISGAIKGLTRGCLGADGWVWIRRFLRHQKNEELNPENNAHKQIIGMLQDQVQRFSENEEFSLFLAPYMGLTSPIGRGKGTVQVRKESPERKTFQPPTLGEAQSYAKEIGMPESEVESWHDHFTSNGWLVGGKARMKDWQSALRNAKRNPIVRAASNGTKPWKSAAEMKQAEIDEKNRAYRLKKLREQEAQQ